jgi:hypothetical protein
MDFCQGGREEGGEVRQRQSERTNQTTFDRCGAVRWGKGKGGRERERKAGTLTKLTITPFVGTVVIALINMRTGVEIDEGGGPWQNTTSIQAPTSPSISFQHLHVPPFDPKPSRRCLHFAAELVGGCEGGLG